jgi:hypothetical protein
MDTIVVSCICFFKSVDNIRTLLTSGQSTNENMKIDYNYGGNLPIGTYTLTATFDLGNSISNVVAEGNKIEPYPFTFRVASQNETQEIICQSHSGNTYNINIPLNIELIGGTSIAVTVVGSFVLNRRRHRRN